MREFERTVILDGIDRCWRGHLYEMDYLKEGIGLRAMAQSDPVVEYKREGYDLFVGMIAALKEDVVATLFSAPGPARSASAPP
jgi:preprotein translocase subunit SecA